MSAWMANLEASHIRRSPEAISACRGLLVGGGRALTDDEAVAEAVEVIHLHVRLAALTGRAGGDARQAFAVAASHTITERERPAASRMGPTGGGRSFGS